LAAKAQRFAQDVRKSYPVFLAGRLLGPNAKVRRWIGELQKRAWAELGRPTLSERFLSVAAVGAALWTSLTLRLGIFQHPKLTRTAYRLPEGSWGHFGAWEGLAGRIKVPGLSVHVEFQHARQQVWLRLEGVLKAGQAEAFWRQIQESLAQSRNRLVLDMKKLKCEEGGWSVALHRALVNYRSRIRLILPRLSHAHPELLILAQIFRQY
jgi:hypothetical protein